MFSKKPKGLKVGSDKVNLAQKYPFAPVFEKEAIAISERINKSHEMVMDIISEKEKKKLKHRVKHLIKEIKDTFMEFYPYENTDYDELTDDEKYDILEAYIDELRENENLHAIILSQFEEIIHCFDLLSLKDIRKINEVLDNFNIQSFEDYSSLGEDKRPNKDGIIIENSELEIFFNAFSIIFKKVLP